MNFLFLLLNRLSLLLGVAALGEPQMRVEIRVTAIVPE